MKLTDEQIKQALEYCKNNQCNSEECPNYFEGSADILECRKIAIQNAIDYINRLEVENKALNRDNDRLLEEIQDVKESERKTAKKYHAKLIDAYKKLKTARNEAVKEFAEEVKMEFYREFDEIIPSIMADRIDNLLKEKMGEDG